MAQEVEQDIFYLNKAALNQTGGKATTFSEKNNAYTGADIKAVMYMPLYTRGASSKKYKVFGDLQTISISRTRSVSPVRVLGRADALTYTRGARTIAGTMVFATINKDAFNEVHDLSVAESLMSSSTGFVSDQLPPFSIVILASNEHGGVAIQMLHGITLTNYGTTYSVNDMYTETTYTYVATQMTPLMVDPNFIRDYRNSQALETMKSISVYVSDKMKAAYTASTKTISKVIQDAYNQDLQRQRTLNSDLVFP